VKVNIKILQQNLDRKVYGRIEEKMAISIVREREKEKERGRSCLDQS
jgi:hypothetical protein